MAAEKVHVLWSPNVAEEFATYSSQLKIYSVKKRHKQDVDSDDDINSDMPSDTDLELSNNSYGRLLANVPEAQCNPMYKTVAWQQNMVNTHCFAIGESNGKVSLISANPGNPLANTKVYQLSTKTLGRTCHTVSWNPDNVKLLSQGLDKTRADSSLIVWDVSRALLTSNGGSSDSKSKTGSLSSQSDESGKVFETGNSESTHSLSWIPGQPNCLIAGMGSTYLKIFDIRDSGKEPKAFAQNKAIFGLAVDPTNCNQIASFAKSNTVFMWDTRNFRNPVYSFQRHGNIVQVQWIPTRPGHLSVILSDSPFLRLVDIPSLSQSPDTLEEYLSHHMNDRLPLATKKIRKMCTCVDWHSSWTNTGLYVTNEGEVKELNVFDKIPVTWSSCDPLTYVMNGEVISRNIDCGSDCEEFNDISYCMLRRVKKGYGFDVSTNVQILNKGSSLYHIWSWIKEQTSSSAYEKMKKVGGVNAVLEPILSPDVHLPSTGSTPQGNTLVYPTYSSTERNSALKLCGWGFVTTNTLENFVKREEMNERYERAAAIAVFLGDIKLSISCLKEGALTATRINSPLSNDLNLIALALAGYSPNEHSLWLETCSSIIKQIVHPYLRAIFSFLCASATPEGFKAVLSDAGVRLQDRVALACLYLNDKKLKEYLTSETGSVIQGGQIEGLFLTGLEDASGIDLLESYVNKTGDVQSACLIAGQSFSGVPKGNLLVPVWFNGYRELLDQWQLWKERAMFDHERKLRDHTHKSPRQAAILCTFCSKAISSDVLRQDLSNRNKKSTSCPSCRKPLPRCSLCLLHMVAGANKGKGQGLPDQSDQFDRWFTWCQTCRHGGHASHITEWFRSHEVCPVTDCNCHCMSLDCLNA